MKYWWSVLLFLGLSVTSRLTWGQTILPDVIIGDPNDPSNDIIGEPISKEEEKASLSKVTEKLGPKEDPITRSGFFQGDIMIRSKDELYQIIEGDPLGQMSAVKNPQRTWPDADIPYVISSSFTSQERSTIARAIAEYHQRTCVTFVPRTTHSDYVHILKGQGCSSAVGRSGGVQVVSLGNGCVYLGVIMHELMHAAGFWHEQSRFDRDNYVTIHWNNIQPQLTYNFDKKSSSVTTDLGLSYDYGSIMHYGPHAFAKDYRYPTIEPKQNGVTIGQRDGFSELDVKGLNLLYKCSGTGPTPKPTPEPEDCVNKNQYCAYWAASGFCFTNNAYMKINCKKSCNFCGTSDCEDQNRYCSSWAKNGQCQQNPKYMSLFCKKSCNLCGAASSSCVDHNSYCQDWSRRQECKRNQAYMSLYCSKSCGSCKDSPANEVADDHIPAIKPPYSAQ